MRSLQAAEHMPGLLLRYKLGRAAQPIDGRCPFHVEAVVANHVEQFANYATYSYLCLSMVPMPMVAVLALRVFSSTV